MSLETVKVREFIVRYTEDLQDEADLKELFGPLKNDHCHALIYKVRGEMHSVIGKTPQHLIFVDAIKQERSEEIELLLQAQIFHPESSLNIAQINFYQPEDSVAAGKTVTKELLNDSAYLLLESIRPSLMYPYGVIVTWTNHHGKTLPNWGFFYPPADIKEEVLATASCGEVA